MKDRSNDQPGAQRHAEGEYGDRARKRNREQLQEPLEAEQPDGQQTDGSNDSSVGRHRIYEDRQQHDEADKNSEKNRLARDRERAADE